MQENITSRMRKSSGVNSVSMESKTEKNKPPVNSNGDVSTERNTGRVKLNGANVINHGSKRTITNGILKDQNINQ